MTPLHKIMLANNRPHLMPIHNIVFFLIFPFLLCNFNTPKSYSYSIIYISTGKKTGSSMNSICIYLQLPGENRNNQNKSINRSFISLIFSKFPQTQAILPKVKFSSSVICSFHSTRPLFILHSHSELQHVLKL